MDAFQFFLKITNVNKNFNLYMLNPICGKNENFTDFFVLFLIEKKIVNLLKINDFFNFNFQRLLK